jgi:WD40 repeat protein
MEIKELFQTSSAVFSISLFLDKKQIYTSERNGDVIEWHLNENNLELIKLRTLLTHKGSVFEVYFEEKTKTCISIDTSGYLKSINLVSGLINELQITKYSLLSLDRKTDNIIMGNNKGSIFFGQINNINEFYADETSEIRGLCLSKKSKWFCSASRNGILRLHNINTKQNWILYKIHDYLYNVKFSFDYKIITVCTGDGNVIFIKFDKEIDDFSIEDMDDWYAKNYF